MRRYPPPIDWTVIWAIIGILVVIAVVRIAF